MERDYAERTRLLTLSRLPILVEVWMFWRVEDIRGILSKLKRV